MGDKNKKPATKSAPAKGGATNKGKATATAKKPK